LLETMQYRSVGVSGDYCRPLLKRMASFIAAVVLLGTGVPVWACPVELPSGWIVIKDRRLTVEVAASPSARSCGLSHRAYLPENHGMLFVEPEPSVLAFWMKDTHIPLSIAFIDDAGRIVDIQQMEPLEKTRYHRSPSKVRFALEVNRGWFDKHGIVRGHTVEMHIPLGLDIR